MMKPIKSKSGGLQIAAAMLLPLLISGCSMIQMPSWQTNEWLADYETAERRASERDTGTIIYYRDVKPHRPDEMEDSLRAAVANSPFEAYVRCILYKDHAPDRKYVAQFGIDRSPAVVILHPDGTYHAMAGWMPAEDLSAFIAGANPPGQSPNWNPFLRREAQFNWLGTLAAGQAAARDSNRSMLVVYYRVWSDDLQRLDAMMQRPEVHRRFADMIHVRTGSVWSIAETAETPFGTLQLPAIVLVEQDGSHRVLELPRDYTDVIYFADAVQPPDESLATESPGTAAVLGSN